MTDHLTKERRSWNMSRIKNKNTKPEMLVRRYLYSKGYRYRLHNSKLPGKPDISNSSKKSAVFINGCFWHRHGCKYTTTPKTNTVFWVKKFNKTIERDKNNYKLLTNNGWKIIVIWECETFDNQLLESLLDGIIHHE